MGGELAAIDGRSRVPGRLPSTAPGPIDLFGAVVVQEQARLFRDMLKMSHRGVAEEVERQTFICCLIIAHRNDSMCLLSNCHASKLGVLALPGRKHTRHSLSALHRSSLLGM